MVKSKHTLYLWVFLSPTDVPGRWPQACLVECDLAVLWVSYLTNWFLIDQEDAGGEDGARGCGTRTWGSEHHRGGREYLDCQSLWPTGKDLESWATGETGTECVASPFWADCLPVFAY